MIKRPEGMAALESGNTPIVTPLTFKAKDAGVQPADECLSGAWVIAPTDGSFPAYAVRV